MESIQNAQMRLQANTNMATARGLVKKANASNEPVSLDKNEIIRGLVTDLRPGLVKLKLANRQTVVGLLEGNNEVSIGDVAAFKILKNEGGNLTLKKLNTNVTAEDATIIKALEEADLVVNEENHSVVKELLYHKLPINKETINMILNKKEAFPNASIDTLVHLIKHGIEPDEAYLNHFEEYKNFDHRLMQHFDQITGEFDLLLKDAALRVPSSTFLTMAGKLFDFLSIEPKDLTESAILVPDMEELTLQENKDLIHDEMAEGEEESFASIKQSHGLDFTLDLSRKEQRQLLKVFGSYELSDEYTKALQDNTASLRDTVNYLTEAISYFSENAPAEIANFRIPLVQEIFTAFSEFQKTNEELASLLSTGERMELLDALSEVPLSVKDAAIIANGEIGIQEFSSLVCAYSTSEFESSIRSLFSKSGFTKLLSFFMEKEFSLTPEQMIEDGNSVTEYYNSLDEKMADLKDIASMANGRTETFGLNQKMEGLNSNLDFMQEFNKLFTYIQLPMRLKDQITHGDLYVYTNKKKLSQNNKDISILLHLDMDHLGPLDIHLSLHGTSLHSKFYVADKDTKLIMQKSVNDLASRLNEKGFTMTNEFYEQEKQADILKDIVDRETNTANPIKRYSFDIRA